MNLRLASICAVVGIGATAAVLLLHGSGGSGGSGAGMPPLVTRPAPSATAAPLPRTGVPGVPAAPAGAPPLAVLPGLLDRLNHDTASFAKGQFSLLQDLERAVAEQITKILGGLPHP